MSIFNRSKYSMPLVQTSLAKQPLPT
jgi:hypothetical protein